MTVAVIYVPFKITIVKMGIVKIDAAQLKTAAPDNEINPVPSEKPYNITLTWASDPRTSQTISWQSDGFNKGVIQFARSGSAAPAFSKAAVKYSTDSRLVSPDGKTLYLHHATLTGLRPNTKYLYRVGDGNGWSQQLSFTTAGDSDSFKFLVFGDSQSGDKYLTWKQTLQNAISSSPQPRFFVIAGDLLDDGNNLKEWSNWLQAGKGVIDRIPTMTKFSVKMST